MQATLWLFTSGAIWPFSGVIFRKQAFKWGCLKTTAHYVQFGCLPMKLKKSRLSIQFFIRQSNFAFGKSNLTITMLLLHKLVYLIEQWGLLISWFNDINGHQCNSKRLFIQTSYAVINYNFISSSTFISTNVN